MRFDTLHAATTGAILAWAVRLRSLRPLLVLERCLVLELFLVFLLTAREFVADYTEELIKRLEKMLDGKSPSPYEGEDDLDHVRAQPISLGPVAFGSAQTHLLEQVKVSVPMIAKMVCRCRCESATCSW